MNQTSEQRQVSATASPSRLYQVVLAIQLTLPRAAVGWLFALLTSNYNRISIHEMGIAAVTITGLLALYHFLSPFQVIFGRLADRFPMFGYRRSSYVLIGLLLSSLAVAGLPSATYAMSQGFASGFAQVFGLLMLFGIGFAMSGVSHLSLVADVVPQHRRGLQVAMIWAMLLVGMIVSLAFIRAFMPEYDYERMQVLYALTVPIVVGVTLLGLIGVEKRQRASERAASPPESASDEPRRNEAALLLRFVQDAAAEPNSRNFFLFVFVALMGIGIQDNILEVFGAEVLDMTVGETGQFQQLWGAGSLVGMFVMGIATLRRSVSSRTAITVGLLGIAAGLAAVAFGAFIAAGSVVLIALVAFGFFNGFFLVGALTTMMDMTTEEDRGAYMGLWGLSLALANGFASILGGALVTGFIESGIATASVGYGGIFLFEALLMLASLYFIRSVDTRHFQRVSVRGMTNTMATDMG